jgi:hypothetical protein
MPSRHWRPLRSELGVHFLPGLLSPLHLAREAVPIFPKGPDHSFDLGVAGRACSTSRRELATVRWADASASLAC